MACFSLVAKKTKSSKDRLIVTLHGAVEAPVCLVQLAFFFFARSFRLSLGLIRLGVQIRPEARSKRQSVLVLDRVLCGV